MALEFPHVEVVGVDLAPNTARYIHLQISYDHVVHRACFNYADLPRPTAGKVLFHPSVKLIVLTRSVDSNLTM
jgi:hypothetical protein